MICTALSRFKLLGTRLGKEIDKKKMKKELESQSRLDQFKERIFVLPVILISGQKKLIHNAILFINTPTMPCSKYNKGHWLTDRLYWVTIAGNEKTLVTDQASGSKT